MIRKVALSLKFLFLSSVVITASGGSALTITTYTCSSWVWACNRHSCNSGHLLGAALFEMIFVEEFLKQKQ